MPTYRIVIGNRELDIQAPDFEEACATASAQYPGELISGFYAIPETEEPAEEPAQEEGGENNGN